MKFIYWNKINSIEMTSPDSDFPASNMLTDYVKQKAKATASTTTVTATCSRLGAIGIFGTNATSVVIDISSGLSIEWSAEDGLSWSAEDGLSWQDDLVLANLGTYYPSDYDYRVDNNGKIFVEYENPETGIGHNISMAFTCPSNEYVEIGVIYAGRRYEYNNPLAGRITYRIVDYSTVRELNSPGAMYVEDRDQVKTWSFDVVMDEVLPGKVWDAVPTGLDFYDFINKVVGRAQHKPFPCWFVDDDYQHFAFCRITKGGMPSATLGEMTSHIRMRIEFSEVV